MGDFLLKDKILWGKKCDPLDVLLGEPPPQWGQEKLTPPHLEWVLRKGFFECNAMIRKRSFET